MTATATATENRVTLKSLKVHDDMSEETTCFSASLYFDGKRVGTVRNDGRGGCHMYDVPHKKLRELEEWARTQDLEFDIEHLDQIVNHQIVVIEETKWLKRNCRKYTCFRLKGDPSGQWRKLNGVGEPARKWLAKHYNEDQIERIGNDEIEGAK